MFNFCSLYSGSSGNSLFVETENTKLLIDTGVSCRKIENALQSIDIKPEAIDGILVTHEHIDHVNSLGTLSKKYNIPVFSTQETFDAMPKQTDKISDDNKKTFKINNKFEINDLEILPFSIPHDAANPCGFCISKDNKKISIATDIGHMTKDIVEHLENSSFILLESNYDPEVLKCSPYPYTLKQRISGPIGHLSNNMAGKTISYLLQGNLKEAMLGHLSKHSNFPELAYKTVVEEIMCSNSKQSEIRLSVANRDEPTKLVEVV